MKRIAVLFVLLVGTVYPQTYYLNVWSKGKVTSIPVSEIKRLMFSATSVTGVVETTKVQELIKTFELFQNYPNPFNPTTQIEYQITSAGHVEVQVFNINGELIKTLTNAELSAGKYSVCWNGKDKNNNSVASGIYIYRVMSGNSILSKKMLLLK